MSAHGARQPLHPQFVFAAFQPFRQPGRNGISNPRMGQVALQESLFDGFRTYNNIKGAEALVEATREDLRVPRLTCC